MDNEKYREKIKHGTILFPVAFYSGIIGIDVSEMYLHKHNEMEWIRVNEGEGSFFINAIEYKAKKGDFFILPSEALHLGTVEKGKTCSIETVVFSLDILKSRHSDINEVDFINPIATNEIILPIHIKNENVLNSEVSKTYSEIKLMHKEKKKAYELGIKGLFLRFFYFVISNDYYSKNKFDKKLNTKVERLREIIKYIEKNYQYPITIDDASNHLKISRYYFCKVFKAATGYSFVEYLNSFRLTKTIKSIVSTNDSITKIAFENGFNSFSYFIRLFKKKYNETPLNYRKKWSRK